MNPRTTPQERELIDRAATGTDLTDFVITRASDAARRVLVERDRFEVRVAHERWPPQVRSLSPAEGSGR